VLSYDDSISIFAVSPVIFLVELNYAEYLTLEISPEKQLEKQKVRDKMERR